MMNVVIALLVFQLLCSVNCLPGTTRHLEAIFLGRCWSFQSAGHQQPYLVPQQPLNCSKLWSLFTAGWEFQDPCKVPEKNYDAYFKMLDTGKALTNKTLFWSGTREIAHRLTYLHDDYITLEDTFPGYILDGLHFCGGKKGFDYSGCPEMNKCPKSHVLGSYWLYASEQFAKKANGIAYVLVNGSRANSAAYSKKSVFGSKELPALNASAVSELRVLVVNDIHHFWRNESCNTGSIKQLMKDSRRKGIKTSCSEDPSFVLSILCLKYPHAEECRRRVLIFNRKNNVALYWLATLLAISCLAFLILAAYLLVRKIRKEKEIPWTREDSI